MDRAISWSIALVAFVVYALGACRTIYVGDSGELVTAVHLLGIPHPSGYPLYVLLGKLWTLLLPIGSIAYRMSLFSALCGAVSCGLLYRACREVSIDRVPAVAAALMLGFSGSFWGEANIQRVYTLNVLFVTLVSWLAMRWLRARDGRVLLVAFFAAGVGASNHTAMAVVAAGLAVFVIAVDRSLVWHPRRLALAASMFGLGLLPYAYLPLRSRMNPPLDWGDPETFRAFLNVVTRSDFWARRWYERPSDLLAAGGDYLRSFGQEMTWIGVGLAVLAIPGVLRWFLKSLAWRARVARPTSNSRDLSTRAGVDRSWAVLFALLVMAGNFLAVALHGSRSDIFIWHRYYLPSYTMLALLAGIGVQRLFEQRPRSPQSPTLGPHRSLAPLALLMPAFLLATGFREHDRSRYAIAEDFSRTILRELPPGARLIASDDNILFVLIYLHFVEGLRPDIDLILEGVGSTYLPPVHFNPDTDPLFLTHYPSWRIEGLELAPAGLVFQTVRSGSRREEARFDRPHLAGELDSRIPKDYLTQNLIGHFHYMRGVNLEDRDWIEARREYELAAALAPDNDVLFYNLGIIFRENGLLEDSIAAFRRSDAINPRRAFGHEYPSAREELDKVLSEQDRIRGVEEALGLDPDVVALGSDTPASHERLSQLLAARGEHAAARGRHLRNLEAAAGILPKSPSHGGPGL